MLKFNFTQSEFSYFLIFNTVLILLQIIMLNRLFKK